MCKYKGYWGSITHTVKARTKNEAVKKLIAWAVEHHYDDPYDFVIKICNKRKENTIMKKISAIVGIIGFLLVFCTAGASDLNTISFAQVCVQLSVGALLIMCSYILCLADRCMN